MTATLTTPGGSAISRGTMRALEVVGPRVARMAAVPLTQPARGEVRVAIAGCGVCASSAPVWEGRSWFAYPMEPGAPGHEGWGTVDALGTDVRDLRIGDRVAYLSSHAFASHEVVPASRAVPLEAIAADMPFPGEAFGCAMNIADASRITPNDVVAVIGIGFLGAVLVRLARAAGATVVAISRRPWSLDLATSLGAADTVALDAHESVVERVHAIRPGGVDVSIEATGAQMPLDVAADITREEGRLVIAGYHQDGRRTVDLQLWNWRAFEVVNAHRRHPDAYLDGMRRAAAAVGTGVLDPDRFITHRFPLADAANAFALLAERPDGFLKAVVMP